MKIRIVSFLLLVIAHFSWAHELQQLFNNAENNEKLTIPAGTYRGDFIIAHPVTITGAGKVIFEGTECALTIRADYVKIRNLTIYCKNFGIKLENVHDCIISDNYITGKNERDVAKKGNGIHIAKGSANLVENNIISDVQDGIYFDHTENNRVYRNIVLNSRYGYHIMYSQKNMLMANQTKESTIGAMVMESPGSILKNNNFSGERNIHGSGITIYISQNCVIENNIIKNNTIGLALDNISDTLIKGNLISSNATGIKKVGKVSKTHFTLNRIIGNVIQIGGRRKWNPEVWSLNKKGNYWDDYKGFDLDGDGIGDGAYRANNDVPALFEKERYLGIFFGSPLCAFLESINLADESCDSNPLLTPK